MYIIFLPKKRYSTEYHEYMWGAPLAAITSLNLEFSKV